MWEQQARCISSSLKGVHAICHFTFYIGCWWHICCQYMLCGMLAFDHGRLQSVCICKGMVCANPAVLEVSNVQVICGLHCFGPFKQDDGWLACGNSVNSDRVMFRHNRLGHKLMRAIVWHGVSTEHRLMLQEWLVDDVLQENGKALVSAICVETVALVSGCFAGHLRQ